MDNENLKAFICAASNDDHFIVKPATLQCGHAVCLSCIEFLKLNNDIGCFICKLCGKENKIDFNIIDKMIDINEQIDVQIETAKEEIDNKIELIKTQLDEMKASLVSKMNGFKDKFKDYAIEKYEKPNDDLLNDLRLINENKSQQNEKLFDKFQTNLKELNESIQYLQDFKPKATFSSNNLKLPIELFGTIDCNFVNLLKKINVNNYEIIDLDFEIRGICAIDNTSLLATCSKQKYITLFNENFKVTRTFDEIHNNNNMSPRYIATNFKDKIYLVQSYFNKITIVDFNFKFIKDYGGEKGSDIGQFDCPLGICYYQGSIFICDSLNQRIQKFTEDLVFQQSYELNFKPWDIKITNNVACIRPNGLEFIYIYNISPFKLIKSISNGNGAIYNTQFWFYELSLNKFLNCYDLNGKLVDRVCIKILNDIDISDGQVSLEYFNSNLVISCKKAKKLIVLSSADA